MPLSSSSGPSTSGAFGAGSAGVLGSDGMISAATSRMEATGAGSDRRGEYLPTPMRDRWLSIHACIAAGLSTGALSFLYLLAVGKLTPYVLDIFLAVITRYHEVSRVSVGFRQIPLYEILGRAEPRGMYCI